MGLLGPTNALSQTLSSENNTTAALPNKSLSAKRVVVIGAGLTGLCSALRLSRAGANVTILEATDRLGGRSLTLRHGDRFQEIDWLTPSTMRFETVDHMLANDPSNYVNAGPGRIPQHHARVLDYCKELQVELQPYIFHDSANLLQNDEWFGGKPVQIRQVQNDLRGHLAEMLAKVQKQQKLDELIDASDVNAFLGMLEQFGQLTAQGAKLVYQGASITDDNPRSGYCVFH